MSKLKLSHSSLSRYQECPKSFELHYHQRIVSKYKSGALYFGSALDAGINVLLNGGNVKEAEKVFLETWEVGLDSENKKVLLRENENITYAASDFDKDLLSPTEQNELDLDMFSVINQKKSEVGWSNLSVHERRLVNNINWLSLRKKGLLMVNAYQTKMMPFFKKVLAVQKYVKLENEDEDSIIGYIDLIAELQDGQVAIIDNKTSSMEYENDSVMKSPQLSIYKTILNNEALDPKGEWRRPIDLAGFAVINKQISKNLDKTCKSCGFKAEKGSTHKTCYNIVNGKRCPGDWDRKVEFDVQTQFILDKISNDTQMMILENASEIKNSIKAGIFTRNFNSCIKPWGKCPYYSLCWHNSKEDLIELPPKKIDNE